MSFFKVTVSGLETIDEDFELESRKIEKAFPQALQYVGSEMIVSLQKHIFEDWYKPWGPPLIYIRRTDNNSLGTPLGSKENMDVFVDNDSLEFTYEPTGDHAVSDWNSVSGDKLIEIIQTNSGWSYPVGVDKIGRTIMPRPFWNFFVEEQANSGIIDAFIKGMSPFATVIPEGVGKDVVFDGGESMLQGGMASNFDKNSDDSDDELPF